MLAVFFYLKVDFRAFGTRTCRRNTENLVKIPLLYLIWRYILRIIKFSFS